jgi:hypothetical protein
MSKTFARLGFNGQSGVHLTCSGLAWSTSHNWPLSGFFWTVQCAPNMSDGTGSHQLFSGTNRKRD